MNDAASIVNRVAEAYESLTSYADRGVILDMHRNDEAPDEMHFRTWFARPDRIRLDWNSHHPYPPLRHIVTTYAVCADGSKIWWWQDDPPRLDVEEEVGLAFAGAATLYVPNLLLHDKIGAFPFHSLTDTKIETTALDGVGCYLLIGEHPAGVEYRLWIAESDFLIRRIRSDSRTTLEDNDVYTGISETIYEEVQPNVQVDAEVFVKVESLLTAG